MKPIRRRVWSHESLVTEKSTTVKHVRLSAPRRISSFSELVQLVAEVSYMNPDYSLFFRGQPRDYVDEEEGSTIMPSLYRRDKNGRLPRSLIRERFATLNDLEGCLIDRFPGLSPHKARLLTLKRFSEVCWALLQHYEVAPTPMLDLTMSLRVACSFATESGERDGVLMVLGLPHPQGSISYHVEQQLCTLRLLTICPPEANRPHFQEGFVAGNFPTRGAEPIASKPDFARRLVAKFTVPASMWSTRFPAIPQGALFPKDDRMLVLARSIQEGVGASNPGIEQTA